MAIPTKYDGIEYRSRLEARWAAFMRNIGWDIVYEPFDGDGYIPDFLVQGERPLLIEVKPAVTQADYEAAVPKAERGLADHWTHDILIVGASPFPSCWGDHGGEGVVAGWTGEPEPDADVKIGWYWNEAAWFKCLSCHALSVFNIVNSFSGRPCGCYDGNGHLGNPPLSAMQSMWADACNDVKWKGSPVEPRQVDNSCRMCGPRKRPSGPLCNTCVEYILGSR